MLEKLMEIYKPDFLWLRQQEGSSWSSAEIKHVVDGHVLISLNNGAYKSRLHKDLALLISTSGSTGSCKYVRLSYQNLWSNASAISSYMKLTTDELPITTLTPSYSYGLSIIHSHLWVGAGLAVTNKTFFDKDFWSFIRKVKATSLSGVPYHYEMLKKLRFTKMELPHLRTLTQAGGSMNPNLTQEYATHCQNNDMRFFTMYGQTEASPRMSFVPFEQAVKKAGTIGIPIPGGTLELQSEAGAVLTEAHTAGELVYRGPNVCLGYAECRSDLLLGDVNCGVLHTGDLAVRDEDGYYRIIGRKNRFIKLFGKRVNLQEVELQLSNYGLDLACSGHDLLEVYLVSSSADLALEIKQTVMASLQVGAQGIAVYEVDALPRNESGKVRYTDLQPERVRRLA